MISTNISFVRVVFVIGFLANVSTSNAQKLTEDDILSYEIDLNTQNLSFYLKDNNDSNYANYQNLKNKLKADDMELVFAMNGGMYNRDGSPQGLYIENGKIISPIDTLQEAFGNFYMQPNGVFAILQKGEGVISKSTAFTNDNVRFATQSGPMLLIQGKFHPKFREGSKNVHIRNGVGVLPNGHLLFAMSKRKVNFYDFAEYFKAKGCLNALYLDGFVSRTYLPSKDWIQLDGNFGVIIAEVK